MKALALACCALLILGGALRAQMPAQPADPQQARPALPVTPLPVAPSTNAPDAATTSAASVSIIADSSLRNVLQELAQTWADSQDLNPQVPLTLTNAATLRAKVESHGAFDVVIGADLDDMKEMTDKGILLPDQRSLARNTLVIYGRKALVKDDGLEWFDLIGSEWKKIALPNPDLAASGRAARHALQKHDLFDDDHKSLYVEAGTEQLALQIVEREQADAVFLYRTDLANFSLPGFDVFPITSDDAPPIFYTAAISSTAQDPALAKSFLDYCSGEAAREIWKKYGFETN
jgi:molybdate transport system substrate-binding protein